MSLTSTTAAESITATDQDFLLTSVTGLGTDDLLKVDSEFMRVHAVDTTTYRVWVERGYNRSLAVAHNILALAVFGNPDDFQPILPWHLYTYGADGAIRVGPGIHKVVKGSAASLTLRAPRADEEGLTLQIIAGSAFGHNIALDSGYFNGSGDPQITLNGAIGDMVELVALGGSWAVSLGKNYAFASASPSISPSVSASKSPSASNSPSSS